MHVYSCVCLASRLYREQRGTANLDRRCQDPPRMRRPKTPLPARLSILRYGGWAHVPVGFGPIYGQNFKLIKNQIASIHH